MIRRCRMLFFYFVILCFSSASVLIWCIYSPPRFLISYLSRFYPDVIFHFNLPSSLRTLALTLDDFPNPNDLSISLEILDVLRRYNAKCTLFTIGSNVERHRSSSQLDILFQRVKDDGHELGNHGWQDEKAIRLSSEQLQQQIRNTEQMINNYSFPKTPWFRPGSGFFNRTMINLCTRLGYRLVLGSIYPHDPQISHSTLNSYFIQSKLYSGGIIILHDRPATVQTLKLLLPNIQKRSFRLTTLTELDHLARHPS